MKNLDKLILTAALTSVFSIILLIEFADLLDGVSPWGVIAVVDTIYVFIFNQCYGFIKKITNE